MLYNALMHKYKFGQAHCVELLKGMPKNLFCNFWKFIKDSTDFKSLNYFLGIFLIQK
jgi:hypothetical protein